MYIVNEVKKATELPITQEVDSRDTLILQHYDSASNTTETKQVDCGSMSMLVENEINFRQHLDVMKREMMAPYGFYGIEQDLDELMSWVYSGYFDRFAIGDYFIDTMANGQKVIWEIADKNTYKGLNFIDLFIDEDSSKVNFNHIYCIPRDILWRKSFGVFDSSEDVYYGDTQFANGTLPGLAESFSDKLKGYMQEVERNEKGVGGTQENPVIAYFSKIRKIWLPSVMELTGVAIQSYTTTPTNMYTLTGYPSRPLALFNGGNAHLFKNYDYSEQKDGSDMDLVEYYTSDIVEGATRPDNGVYVYTINSGYQPGIIPRTSRSTVGIVPGIVLAYK